jgi:hypothetical protein
VHPKAAAWAANWALPAARVASSWATAAASWEPESDWARAASKLVIRALNEARSA